MPIDISKKVLKNIAEKDIKPTSKLEFVLKEYAIWFGFALTLILGTISIAVTIFVLRIGDFDLARHLTGNLSAFLLNNIPFLWISSFIIFILLADYSLRHTKKGYRFTLAQVLILNLLISIVTGTALSLIGFAQKIDTLAIENIPAYQQRALHKRVDFWTQNDKGFLAGEVTEIISPSNFNLLDLQQRKWEVESKANYGPVKKGDLLRLLGEVKSPNHFQAERIKVLPTDHRNRIPLDRHSNQFERK